MSAPTLNKSERLHRKKQIEKVFAGGARSFSLFPLRVVYLPLDDLDADAAILISVSKRHFKRAVKRNRVKRQIREAYRKNKHLLLDTINGEKCKLALAFIYLSNELPETDVINNKMKVALQRVAEQCSSKEEKQANN
ncbi:MAG: ribonuclease P protein component [Bacteroides sp.]|nr:ribonuclease P protein component [Bacteroides sp.]